MAKAVTWHENYKTNADKTAQKIVLEIFAAGMVATVKKDFKA